MKDASPETARDIELVAVYDLPASLTFAGECLGSSVPVCIAGIGGKVYLPLLHAAGDYPSLVHPSLDDLPGHVETLLLRRGERDHWFWGTVRSWNSVSQEVNRAEVSVLLFRFEGLSSREIQYGDYLHGRGYPTGNPVDQIFQEIDSWFEALRLWVRALTAQHVDQQVDAKSITVTAQGLEVLTVEGNTVSLPRTPSSVTVRVMDFDPLDLKTWRRALNLVSQGATPPIEYSLVGSARVELRLGQHRRAVVDAAMAVELVLTRFLNANISALLPGLKTTLSGNEQTLGWLIKTMPKTKALPAATSSILNQLPADCESGLLVTRNDVVHRNKDVTYVDASRAVEIAASVVKLVNPLPI
ncbi:hypothetical protein ABT373_11440 [Streptomyces sp. NPDC000070]|uniref:hypothetical protein n=1 Tax=Streptomyces sp. NPDC000070 TaxID=3154240 RepID=UPI003316753C